MVCNDSRMGCVATNRGNSSRIMFGVYMHLHTEYTRASIAHGKRLCACTCVCVYSSLFPGRYRVYTHCVYMCVVRKENGLSNIYIGCFCIC